MTRWALHFMGSPENARRYSYKIEFPRESPSDNISTSLVWKAPCEAMTEDKDIKFTEHNCLYLHRNLLRTYTELNGNLNYKLTIYSSSPDSLSNMDNLLTDLSIADAD